MTFDIFFPMSFFSHSKSALVIISLLFLNACGGKGSTPTPIIKSFGADADTITLGDSVALTADFANGTAIIDAGVGAISINVAKSVSPTVTTTYKLTVTNSAGSAVTKNVTVTVVPAPIITSFSSLSSSIIFGESATLTSMFSNGTASIDYDVGSVEAESAVAVSPTTTTTYTLTVTNSAGTAITKALEIVVKPILTGYFTDSPVEGLNYETETQLGITNALGAFTYVEGETISFSIGSFILGDTVDAKPAITPLDVIAPSLSLPTNNGELSFLLKISNSVEGTNPILEGIDFAKFQNLLIFLQTLDNDKDASNGITISQGISVLLENVTLNFNANPASFRNALSISGIMPEAVALGLIDTSLIKSAASAIAHFYEAQEITTSFTHVTTRRVKSRSVCCGASSYDTTYTYDANGFPLKATIISSDGSIDGMSAFTYDANGTLLTSSRDYDGDGIADAISTNTWDATGVVVELLNDRTATRSYDAKGNLLTSRIVNVDGTTYQTSTNTWDTNGSLLERTLFIDGRSYIVAKTAEKMWTYTTYINGAVNQQFTYTYDGKGNRVTTREYLRDGTILYTQSYTYNSFNNVLTEILERASGPVRSITYTYDSNGNLLTRDSSDGDFVSTFTYTRSESKIGGLMIDTDYPY
ncbi:hypothetical protein N9M30_00490 [Pseudomonadales bacterium]|nr:hypothetical protein [Pseudomonadales bacterium]